MGSLLGGSQQQAAPAAAAPAASPFPQVPAMQNPMQSAMQQGAGGNQNAQALAGIANAPQHISASFSPQTSPMQSAIASLQGSMGNGGGMMKDTLAGMLQ